MAAAVGLERYHPEDVSADEQYGPADDAEQGPYCENSPKCAVTGDDAGQAVHSRNEAENTLRRQLTKSAYRGRC